MQDLLIIDSLRELQVKESNLSDELNVKLTELYKWYNDQLNLISDDMLCILNNPKLIYKRNSGLDKISRFEKNRYGSDRDRISSIKYNEDSRDISNISTGGNTGNSNTKSINNSNTKSGSNSSSIDRYDSSTTSNSGGKDGKIGNEIELSFENLCIGDKIIDFDSQDHGTKSWPRFWLHALMGCNTTKFWISHEDFEVLYHLNDIRVQVFESNENSESFEISFQFTENPFFTNSRIWRRFDFNKNLAKSESSLIDWIVKDSSDYTTGFFRFFDSEMEYDDLKMAICIKDRIRRDPLKYVLRYQSQLDGEEYEPDSDDEYSETTQVGSRYPFSWLFSK